MPIFVPIYYHVVMYIVFTYEEFVPSSASVKKIRAPVKYSRINAKIPLLCILVNDCTKADNLFKLRRGIAGGIVGPGYSSGG